MTREITMERTAVSGVAEKSMPTRRRGSDRIGTLMMLPGQIVSLLVLVMPLLVALYMSFTDWSPTLGSLFQAGFVGLECLTSHLGAFRAHGHQFHDPVQSGSNPGVWGGWDQSGSDRGRSGIHRGLGNRHRPVSGHWTVFGHRHLPLWKRKPGNPVDHSVRTHVPPGSHRAVFGSGDWYFCDKPVPVACFRS